MKGIYAIHNKINNKMYIGQSINLARRFTNHKVMLRKNKHTNIILQQAWNKYGEENFKFEILDKCAENELNEKEMYYIKKYKTNEKTYGYNIRIDPCNNRGLRWSEEQRKKMNEIINKPDSWYRNHTIPRETMKKAWAANTGRKATEEQSEKMSKLRKGKKKKNTENMKKAQQGESNNGAKLKELEVKEIKLLLQSETYTIKYISQMYNVSYETIYAIKKARSWKNVNVQDIEIAELSKNILKRLGD